MHTIIKSQYLEIAAGFLLTIQAELARRIDFSAF
jgi:hypothetical protein